MKATLAVVALDQASALLNETVRQDAHVELLPNLMR
jgi:hypothetical protein